MALDERRIQRKKTNYMNPNVINSENQQNIKEVEEEVIQILKEEDIDV